MDLLDAAARLFRDRGVAGTTVRAIAEAAGMHLGSVTYRYRTKESLLVASMQRALGRATAAVRAALAGADDPGERLRRALRAHAGCQADDPALAVLFVDWRRFPRRARQALEPERRQYEAMWDGIVYAATGSTELRALILGAASAAAVGGQRSPDELAAALGSLLAGPPLE